MSLKMFKKIFPEKTFKKRTLPNASGSIDVVDGNVKPAFKKVNNLKFEPGTFGKVSAVKLDETGEMCALKKIWFTDPEMLRNIFREVEIMSKLSGDSVVRFYGAWMEEEEFIFIMMELCKDDLKHVLERKPNAFGREPGFPMTSTEYFVSWHILDEIVQGVNYLHHLSPPVIHRDLKPANVLITDGVNGRLVKLCDFGLAKTHEHSSHTNAQGTKKYMAPEVRVGRRYNEKSDVFGIAVIALEVFGFQLTKIKDERGWISYFDTHPEHIYSGTELNDKLRTLVDIVYECITVPHENYNQRPSCDELLARLKVCALEKNTIEVQNINVLLNKILSNK